MKAKILINILLGLIIMLSIGALCASVFFENSVVINPLIISEAFVPALFILMSACVEALIILNKS